ncbi:MAG TPA: ribosome biogenesis GTP-binding protein YihA/YsxC [Armatimonadota bacterium]|nr:ribosome biogenesis GTP-binding protein YihA/YsxC [Armatimonadota bacterium]
MNYQNVKFIKSAAEPKDFISDGLPQVVFAGKSNVGKSSVINRLLNRKNFARVGGTPGKTVHINYFLIDERAYFVDLPGYGYAKVPHAEKERWGKLMETYFRVQDRLALGIMIVDARHDPTPDDQLMANWFLQTGRPMVVAANKADKLKASELAERPAEIRKILRLEPQVPVYLFSAEKGTNRDALISDIEKYAK